MLLTTEQLSSQGSYSYTGQIDSFWDLNHRHAAIIHSTQDMEAAEVIYQHMNKQENETYKHLFQL